MLLYCSKHEKQFTVPQQRKENRLFSLMTELNYFILLTATKQNTGKHCLIRMLNFSRTFTAFFHDILMHISIWLLVFVSPNFVHRLPDRLN